MSDEQRGHGRPDGDVGGNVAGPAADPRTQQPSTPQTGGHSYPASGDETVQHAAIPTGPDANPPAEPQHEAATQQTASPQAWPHNYSGAPYGGSAYGAASHSPGPYGGIPYNTAEQHTASLPADRPQRRSRPMIGIVAAALIAGVVGGAAGFGGAYALLDSGSTSGTVLSSSPASATSAATTNGTVASAASKATPSTVDIRVDLAQGTAEGSGVILTSDGAVLTNNHVVAGSTGTITVTLADGSQHSATVVGTSPSYDLAVIKLQNVSGLTPATLGRTQDVQVGQQVVAIGSPQGLTGTVTTGIVSALNRTVAVQDQQGAGVVYNGLQTDAPINQGNSGGPLVNLDGQVIGINSAIATASGSTGSVGLGFAIPVDQARRVAQEILNTGHATKPVLGVEGSTGGGGSANSQNGATIAQVQPGSPAASAGLAAGDVVTKVGGVTVNDFSDLVAKIGALSPNQKVTLTVRSNGGERQVDVTLGSVVDQAATTTNGGSAGSGGEGNPFGGRNNPFGGLIPFGNN
ncbi:S1C family serine protease [Pseudonocardia acidicola]|uniref:PDZ domain-containing protein n=1 Tax=Pseudonocardia acidicola TaxID=2724939 RepID=A0ABX1SJT5_9PSEU|nr:trypsin-like peptidase domain-containing protein [Pseudonocardia acidicola]NMI00774.1 PDZ domain-containing protein [Pseudonocardia acidicola]